MDIGTEAVEGEVVMLVKVKKGGRSRIGQGLPSECDEELTLIKVKEGGCETWKGLDCCADLIKHCPIKWENP